jgi:hypothetical protein
MLRRKNSQETEWVAYQRWGTGHHKRTRASKRTLSAETFLIITRRRAAVLKPKKGAKRRALLAPTN